MHVAIIMNGNSRWAAQKGLPPEAARAEGVAALRNTVDLASEAGIRTLTLYAICTPGSARPKSEIDADLSVLEEYLRDEAERDRPVRISVIGNSDRWNITLPRQFDCNTPTAGTDSTLHLRIVVDYSAHDDIVKSTWRSPCPQAPENFNRQLCEIDRTALPAGAVDLLVRTGGGYCHSAFMLWEVAYARLHYVDCLWPDFTARRLHRALAGYEGYEPQARQMTALHQASPPETELHVADLTFDMRTLLIRRGTRPVALASTGMRILEQLMRASPGVVTREQIERTVWGDDPPGTDAALRGHILIIRNAVDGATDPKLLHTVHGIGYRLG